MKEYLKTIHQRSSAHKRRFALLVSGGATLFIFGIWSLVVFGSKGVTVADTTTQAGNQNVVSSFEDIKGGVANSLEAVKNQVNQVKQAITTTNVENKYQEVRDQALSN